MSIDRTQQISPATLTELHQEATKRAGRLQIQGSSSASNTRSGTKVSLSNQIQALKTDSSQDINSERLDKIKAALSAGELPIDTDKIAKSLAQDMFQLF